MSEERDVYLELVNFVNVCKQVEGYENHRGIECFSNKLNAIGGYNGMKRQNVIRELVAPIIGTYEKYGSKIIECNFQFLIDDQVKWPLDKKINFPIGKIYEAIQKDSKTTLYIQYSIISILSICSPDDENLKKTISSFSEEQSKDIESVTMNIMKELTKMYSNMKKGMKVKDVLNHLSSNDHMIKVIQEFSDHTLKNKDAIPDLVKKAESMRK